MYKYSCDGYLSTLSPIPLFADTCIVLTLKLQTVNERVGGWRIDPEYGFLRVTANIIKAGVFNYSPDDFKGSKEGEEFAEQFKNAGVVREYIPAEEFTEETIASLEGKPVIVEAHEFKSVENINDGVGGLPAKKGFTGIKVGSIAGRPVIKDGFIECDFLIEDKPTIERIKNGELIEVSAGYDSYNESKSGKFADSEFDAKQTNLRFNHVLLLPKGKGRCGFDVRILNSDHKEKTKMFTIQIKNSKGEIVKVNVESEADGQLVNSLIADVKTANEAAIAEKEGAVASAQDETKKVKSENEGHLANLKALQAALAAATESLEKFSQEEYQESETEVVNANSKDEDEKKKTAAELENCGAACKNANEKMAARKKLITCRIMNSIGKDLKDAPATEIDATFGVLVAQAKTKNAAGKTQKENDLPGFDSKKTNAEPEHILWTAGTEQAK
jgi:hypothetical protein